MNRREFLKTFAVTAAGYGLARKLSWASEAGTRESFRLAFFTDLHARAKWETPQALELAASLIARQDADVLICGGDCITDGLTSTREEVAHRWDILRNHFVQLLPAKPIVAIGNHDCVGAILPVGSIPGADPREPFREFFGLDRTWYAVDAGPIRVFVLDSIDITGDELKYRGFVDDPQLGWLRSELENLPRSIVPVIVTHMPLLTSFFQATEGGESPAPRNRIVVNNLPVLEMLAAHKAPLVLQGHTHVDEWIRWRGTMFITGGAICGKWWRGSWMGTDAGFGVVTLRRDRIDWEYIPLGWEPRRPQKREERSEEKA